jgi:hypothetical protein
MNAHKAVSWCSVRDCPVLLKLSLPSTSFEANHQLFIMR